MRVALPSSARRSRVKPTRLGIDLAERGLSAEGLAELLMDGLEGMKHRVPVPKRSASPRGSLCG